MKRMALLGAAIVLLGVGLAQRAPPQPVAAPAPVVAFPGSDRVDLSRARAGTEIVVSGSTRSSHDGSVFDAATTTRVFPEGVSVQLGGYFEIARAGLEIVRSDDTTHEVRLVVTGAEAPACRAVGLPGACLLPRTRALALDRLLTERELRGSLVGAIRVALPTPTPPPAARVSWFSVAAVVGGLGLAAAALADVLLARRRSLLGRVRIAARAARRAIANEPSLGAAGGKIDDLLARAEALEESRAACEAGLRRLDRRALLRKRAALEAGGAGASEALGWVSRELAEADRMEADLLAATVGLERARAALSVVTLEVREHRNVRARCEDDPADALGEELALREAVIHEVAGITAKVRPGPR